jgi:hypothetical protein
MTSTFDPTIGAVVLGQIVGPLDSVDVKLLIDTGANITAITPVALSAAGFDLTRPLGPMNVTTASSSAGTGGIFRAARLSALGFDRIDFPVLCYPLPTEAEVDGLLGLDFFVGRILTFNFINNTVDIT